MFGAFYVAAVAQVEALVPSSLRATGQALFVALTFGFGGIAGFSASGLFFQHFGGHRLFLLAAFIELLPIAVVWRIKGFKSPENNQAART